MHYWLIYRLCVIYDIFFMHALLINLCVWATYGLIVIYAQLIIMMSFNDLLLFAQPMRVFPSPSLLSISENARGFGCCAAYHPLMLIYGAKRRTLQEKNNKRPPSLLVSTVNGCVNAIFILTTRGCLLLFIVGSWSNTNAGYSTSLRA